jgi:6-phosphofructokinase
LRKKCEFLTAASAAARTVEGDGPHLIYLPERIFDAAKFLSEVKSVHDRLERCVIALSEGIHDTDGTPLSVKLAQTVEKDAHGNVQLSGTGALADLLCEEIKSKLGIKRARRYVRLSERVGRSSLSRRRADREAVVRVAAGARVVSSLPLSNGSMCASIRSTSRCARQGSARYSIPLLPRLSERKPRSCQYQHRRPNKYLIIENDIFPDATRSLFLMLSGRFKASSPG